MVKETRFLFEPGDVLHIRVTCAKCGSVFLYPVAPGFQVPSRCPSCNEWWTENHAIPQNESSVAINQLITLLQAALYFKNTMQDPARPFTVSFELDGSDS